MKPDFVFPVEVRSSGGLKGYLQRYHARKTARMLADNSARTYQFGGYQGALKKSYMLIDADKYQLIHWILTAAGYYCTPAQVMERCGVDPEAKSAPEGTLEVQQERKT